MKKLFSSVLLFAAILVSQSAYSYSGVWQQVDNTKVPARGTQVQHPTKYLVYLLSTDYLKQQLFSVSTDPNNGTVIELPLPDGSFRDFTVWQTPMMPAELAAKYPSIKTFTAEAVGNRTVTAKLDFTDFGFHAMIFDGANTSFIDPFTREDQNYYMVHYKHDEYRPASERMKCLVHSSTQDELQQGEQLEMDKNPLPKLEYRTLSGYQLHTYRLALSADTEYCQAVGGTTVALAFGAMTTSMNRINGVYEREFSITMNFVAKEDTLIWPNSSGVNGACPFDVNTTCNTHGNIDGNANRCLTTNQCVCDGRIGSANYDIGHVFTTGAGGLSSLGCVCQSGQKAQSATGGSNPVGDGFDIDYVAHEMGHEYGADHPFNNGQDGSCGGGNAVQDCAYEPGSGSTIMAYAGICDPDDLQYHSDAYFHSVSLQQIYTYAIASTGGGYGCAVKTATNNKPAAIGSFTASYDIPYKTPFELIAPTATDSVADTSTTYCWEQWNLGDFGSRLNQTFFSGPIFRSYDPAVSPTRVFPKVSMVIAGVLSNAGMEGAEGEKAPDTARFLTFKLTVRDIFQGNGCFVIPDDTIHLNAINTGAGFKVTSPSGTSTNWTGGSSQTVTWNIVSTNTAPISCSTVDIYLSKDGGNTWPGFIGNFPNTGSASISVPNIATSSFVRIKVKGHGNVFFNLNGSNFTITNNSSLPTVPLGVQQVNSTVADNITVYPVPANNVLNINTALDKTLQVNIVNTLGQSIWKGQMNKSLSIPVHEWAKGVYFLQMTDAETGQHFVKTVSVE